MQERESPKLGWSGDDDDNGHAWGFRHPDAMAICVIDTFAPEVMGSPSYVERCNEECRDHRGYYPDIARSIYSDPKE